MRYPMQDSTLIKVNGKHKWPKNSDDWVWWAPGVPKHLQKVADEGYVRQLIDIAVRLILRY